MKVLIIPGASLMDITPLDNGVRVRCPGCGSEQEFRGKGHRKFTHERRCPVYAQIERAVDVYERDVVKRG